MRLTTLLAATAALSLAAGGAHAALITSDAGYTGPNLDLSAYANGNYNFTFGPVTVGQFTFTRDHTTTNSGNGAVVGQGSYGLAGNGSFDSNPVYIGVDGATGFGHLLGVHAFSQIGFFFNYAPGVGDPPIIEALDALGNVIESHDLSVEAPISTPGGLDQFEFRGITHTTADIYGLAFGGSYLLATGTANGDLPGGIPEPATWALMFLGFGAAGAMLRRRRLALIA